MIGGFRPAENQRNGLVVVLEKDRPSDQGVIATNTKTLWEKYSTAAQKNRPVVTGLLISLKNWHLTLKWSVVLHGAWLRAMKFVLV